VERLHGKIKLPGTGIALWAGQSQIATGYERIVWGDHGPYWEFSPTSLCVEKYRIGSVPYPSRYYDLLELPNGCQIYHQRRSVKNLPNPPHTGRHWTDNNRSEGYADYRIGFYYIDALDTRVALEPTQEVRQPNLW
jgi:hypothetical protein